MKNQSKPITDADIWRTILSRPKTARVKIHGSEWEVVVVDPTHVTMKMVGGETGIAWAYHVAQLDDETVRQLQSAGVMDERRYVR